MSRRVPPEQRSPRGSRNPRVNRRLTAAVLPLIAGLVVIGSVERARLAAAPLPDLYPYCVGMPGKDEPSVSEQAKMLRELGFDGIGHLIWHGNDLEENLRTLDEAGLKPYMLYTYISVDPKKDRPYDPRLLDAIRKLKGRPVTVCVLLQGLPPGDPRGEATAVKTLRELGDAAKEAGVCISIYHHTNDWAETVPHAFEIVRKVNHPNVGANFNLCHWLKVEGEKDYRPVLKRNVDKLFAVAINGAQLGAKEWANGLIQPLDKGTFDNRALLDFLHEIGYRGPIGLMCYGIPGDPREHLERSMKVWKRWASQ